MKTDEKLKPEKAVRPASRWRNKYFNFRSFVCDTGKLHQAGEYSPPETWPSRDIAETHGLEWEREFPKLGKYLGAFPVEGEP